VPQKLSLQDPAATSVKEYVLSGLTSQRKMLGLYKKGEIKSVSEVLKEFGLFDLKDTSMDSLSGGFLQKVLIAKALISRPRILILDEALSNIDPRKENELFDLLKRLRPDLTIVLVTHDIGVVSHHIEKVACLSNKLVVHRTEALTNEVMNEVFGGEVRVISHKHSEDVDHKH